MKPSLSILMLDDYADDEVYTTARVRELHVVHAYLRGDGALESRHTVLGGRRTQIRFQVGGREWLGR